MSYSTSGLEEKSVETASSRQSLASDVDMFDGTLAAVDECVYVPRFLDDGSSDIKVHMDLGSGTFGEVTFATLTTECGEEMTGALKRATLTPGSRSTIARELRLLMPLQGHRNIVEVLACSYTGSEATAMLTKRYPHCLWDAINHYKMQLLHEQDARAARAARGARTTSDSDADPVQPLIPLTVLWPMILALARAMLVLQHHGVVHMDLKPANVVLDDDGQPVIIDFGCAMTVAEGELVTWPMGTPNHLAPEVEDAVAHPAPVDPSMDVYSFGVLVAEAAVGMPAECVCKLEDDEIGGFVPYDDALQWLLSESLHRDPHDRIDMKMWVDSAAEACKRLKCGGRAATRPLLAAAAAGLPAAPTPPTGSTAAAVSAGQTPAAPAPAADDSSPPPPAHGSAPASIVPPCTSVASSSELSTAAKSAMAPEAQPGFERTASMASAGSGTSASLCNPMPSLAGLLLPSAPGPSPPQQQDQDRLLVEALLAMPLPVRLPAVAAPRNTFDTLPDAWTPSAATPHAGGGSPAPSLLQRTPPWAAEPPSPLGDADTPIAPPIALTPRSAAATGTVVGVFESEREEQTGAQSKVLDGVQPRGDAEEGDAEFELGGKAGQRAVAEQECQCAMKCGVDAGVQTEATGVRGVRWERWALAAGVAGVVAAKLFFLRR